MLAKSLTVTKARWPLTKYGTALILAFLGLAIVLGIQIYQKHTQSVKTPPNFLQQEAKPTQGDPTITPTPTPTPKAKKKKVKKVDCRVIAVRNYLQSIGAPLATHANTFVKVADTYGLDYRLLPAISVIESTGGKFLFRPYNPFGWGRRGFASFDQAIWHVGRGIRTGYYNKGFTNPYAIAKVYCPPNSNEWARKVVYVQWRISAQYNRCINKISKK